MTDTLTHRGPDGCGYYKDEHIALGHRRLSIIDIEGGQQPISNEDGSLVLVCNGEIYNSPALREMLQRKKHVFKTSTDVEVILHLYEEHGTACVKMLRGMFAFAIWDARRRSLFLGRDHLTETAILQPGRKRADIRLGDKVAPRFRPNPAATRPRRTLALHVATAGARAGYSFLRHQKIAGGQCYVVQRRKAGYREVLASRLSADFQRQGR